MPKLLALIVLALLMSPVLARDRDGIGTPRHHDRDGYYGAPGPIAGAGLPVLAVGYGVYWLLRRRQRSNARSDY